jgi:CRP/FNR family transcriptional regulator, cyclic AMP receptor protein
VGVATEQPTADPLADALRRGAQHRRFQDGQALFVEGDRAERVYVIDKGWVLMSTTAPSGREIVLGLRGPGHVLGDMSALDGEPRSATAVAIGEVETSVVAAAAFAAVIEDPSAARALIVMLASRLREADRRRLEFSALDTLGRVASRLFELSERFGEQTAEGIAIELPLSQEQLASWCGASREATVKALASLRALGCVQTSRKRVLITDPEALRRHAEGLA